MILKEKKMKLYLTKYKANVNGNIWQFKNNLIILFVQSHNRCGSLRDLPQDTLLSLNLKSHFWDAQYGFVVILVSARARRSQQRGVRNWAPSGFMALLCFELDHKEEYKVQKARQEPLASWTYGKLGKAVTTGTTRYVWFGASRCLKTRLLAGCALKVCSLTPSLTLVDVHGVLWNFCSSENKWSNFLRAAKKALLDCPLQLGRPATNGSRIHKRI